MDYNQLRQETKIFLNKVMDIYSIIEDKIIIRSVKDAFDRKTHVVTKLDKKVLALFIAGFLVDGNLKEIFSQYDDIKLSDLLDFIGIKENDIISIPEDKYEEFYEKNLKLDLMTIIKERNPDKEINFLTPELIIKSLQYASLSGSPILEFFAKEYNEKFILGFYMHPIFKVLENYTFIDGSVSKKDSPKGNDIGTLGLSPSLFVARPNKISTVRPRMGTIDHFNKPKSTSINFDDDSVWLLLEEIQKKFIGQEETAEGLFYNIINNQ